MNATAYGTDSANTTAARLPTKLTCPAEDNEYEPCMQNAKTLIPSETIDARARLRINAVFAHLTRNRMAITSPSANNPGQ